MDKTLAAHLERDENRIDVSLAPVYLIQWGRTTALQATCDAPSSYLTPERNGFFKHKTLIPATEPKQDQIIAKYLRISHSVQTPSFPHSNPRIALNDHPPYFKSNSSLFPLNAIRFGLPRASLTRSLVAHFLVTSCISAGPIGPYKSIAYAANPATTAPPC
jgi:hypothetical protein